MSAIWSITKIECLPEHQGKTNVVFKVEYEVRKSLHKKPWTSVACVNVENLSQNFTPFEQVTEQMVIQWLKDTLTSLRIDMVSDIESALSDELSTVDGLPWEKVALPE
jgi:hypothetical protein